MKQYYNLTRAEDIAYPILHDMACVIGIVDKIAKLVKKDKSLKDNRFAFWCRGSSGAVIASLLCAKFPNRSLINHVKKDGEASHSTRRYITSDKTYNVFVDDFLCTGETLNEVIKEMNYYEVKLHSIWLCGIDKHHITDYINITDGIYARFINQ